MSDETVVARLRPHGRALFWPTVLLLGVVAAVGFLSGIFREQWQNIAVLTAGGLLAFAGWLLPLLRWLARNYTITTRRVVVRGGILVRSRQEVLHSRVLHLTLRTRGLQSLFRSGDVLVETGDEHPVVLGDVPSAKLVQEVLHDLAEQSPSSDRVQP